MKKKVNRLQKNLEFNSIENRLIANEIVNLEFFNCEVEIKRISLNLSTMSYFFIFIKSVFFWVKIYFSKKKYNSFLNFRYRNIHIGDLVASTFLRIHTKYGGNLKMNLDLYKIF